MDIGNPLLYNIIICTIYIYIYVYIMCMCVCFKHMKWYECAIQPCFHLWIDKPWLRTKTQVSKTNKNHHQKWHHHGDLMGFLGHGKFIHQRVLQWQSCWRAFRKSWDVPVALSKTYLPSIVERLLEVVLNKHPNRWKTPQWLPSNTHQQLIMYQGVLWITPSLFISLYI